MSHEYAMSRVRDAIEKCDGNQMKAQRLLLTWMEKDQTLLIGLAAPHLQGIISYAMMHAFQQQKKPLPKRVDLDDADTPPPGKASQKHIDAINTLVSKGKNKAKSKQE